MKNNILPSQRFKPNTHGYAAIISVLIIAAISIGAVTSILLLGTDSLQLVFTSEQSMQSRVLADTCAEEALEQIRELTSYTGSGNMSISGNNCSYAVTSQGGELRIITASSTVGSVVRKVSVSVETINPRVNITAWHEISD